MVVRELRGYLAKQVLLLWALQAAAAAAPAGASTELAHALSNSGLETAALAMLAARSPTRSEHPLLAVNSCAPVADIAFAIPGM